MLITYTSDKRPYYLNRESTSSIEMKTTYSCNMKALRSSSYEFYTT